MGAGEEYLFQSTTRISLASSFNLNGCLKKRGGEKYENVGTEMREREFVKMNCYGTGGSSKTNERN